MGKELQKLSSIMIRLCEALKLAAVGLGIVGIFTISGPAMADKPEAAVYAEKWDRLPQKKVGVTEIDGLVYVLVTRPAVRNVDRRTLSAWGTSRVGEMLYEWAVVGNHRPLTSLEAAALKSCPGSLQVSGHVLKSQRVGDEWIQLFVTKKSNLEAVSVSVDEGVKAAVRKLQRNPEEYPEFFDAVGVKEVALLLNLKNFRTSLYTVDNRPSNLRQFSNKASEFYENRDAVLKRETREASDFIRKSLVCSENPEDFRRQVRGEGVKLVDVNFATPIMQQVALCQGFGVMNPKLASGTSMIMPTVQSLFQRGQALSTAVWLLEASAERHPRSAEVWEYLTAGYRALGDRAKARIANRQWVMTSDDSQNAVRSLLLLMDDDNAASACRKFFDKYYE